ncbi:MAG: hypothetical protein V4559_12025 [Pseudomonadota bacterium]
MLAKAIVSVLTYLILFPGQSFAVDKLTPELPMTNWHWTNTFTAYDSTGKDRHFRSWDSIRGVVNFAVHRGHFEIIIGEPKDGTDTLVKGRIHGHQVTATAVRVQTDEIPQRYRGTFEDDDGAKHISITSSDGDFIGFITQAPPGSETHD